MCVCVYVYVHKEHVSLFFPTPSLTFPNFPFHQVHKQHKNLSRTGCILETYFIVPKSFKTLVAQYSY